MKNIHTCYTIENYEKTQNYLGIDNPNFNQIKAYMEAITDSEIEEIRDKNENSGISAETMVKSTETIKQYTDYVLKKENTSEGC